MIKTGIIQRPLFITPSLLPINKKIKLGITKKRISLAESKNIFDQLCAGELKVKNITFSISKDMQLLPKTHVPSLWNGTDVMVSSVLKPNLWGDRYILEFSSIENSTKFFLSSKDIEVINSNIKKHIPIDLASVYDRIGSSIFQFPITLINSNSGISKDWTKAKLTMNLHPLFIGTQDLLSIVMTKLDDVVTGNHSYSGVYKTKELEIGDSNNLEFKVFNIKNGLIYKHSMGNFIRNLRLHMGVSTQNSEPREFVDSNGNTQKIHLTSSLPGTTIGERGYSYDSRTKERIRQNDILRKSGRFLNVKNGEREKALDFIKKR